MTFFFNKFLHLYRNYTSAYLIIVLIDRWIKPEQQTPTLGCTCSSFWQCQHIRVHRTRLCQLLCNLLNLPKKGHICSSDLVPCVPANLLTQFTPTFHMLCPCLANIWVNSLCDIADVKHSSILQHLDCWPHLRFNINWIRSVVS